MSLVHNGKRLALLKRSVGRNHATERPLYPIEVARSMDELAKELDDKSGSKIAKRFNISSSLVSDFRSMMVIPEKYSDVWGWGPFTGGRIPWSMFRRAGTFLKARIINEDELGMLINGVLNEEIPTSAIESILYLRKKNPDKKFEECCSDILKLIPEKVSYIIFIADVKPSVIKSMKKAALTKSTSPDSLVEDVLKKCLGESSVDGVLIKQDRYVKIAFTEEGRKKLDEIASREDVLLSDIINHLFVKEGFHD